jgi:DUF917 family protein
VKINPITLDDIECLAVGPRQVELMSPLDLADDDLVAVLSNMGPPLIGQERLADSRNIARAAQIQEEYSGRKFHAVMSLEIGGGNGIQPPVRASRGPRTGRAADPELVFQRPGSWIPGSPLCGAPE